MKLCAAITVFVLLFSSACSVVSRSRRITLADNHAKHKEYDRAVAAYRELLEANPPSLYSADARYALAMMLMAYDNPQKDYAQALHQCEEFTKLHPNDRRTPEIRNAIGLLKTVTSLNKNIEELKNLDIRHEERRRK